MIKVFVSQPMRGLSDEDILLKRDELFEIAKRKIRAGSFENDGLNPEDEIELVDSFFENEPDEEVLTKPVYFLGESIKKLAQADIAIFAGDWEKARGCRVENKICIEYGISVIEAYSTL